MRIAGKLTPLPFLLLPEPDEGLLDPCGEFPSLFGLWDGVAFF